MKSAKQNKIRIIDLVANKRRYLIRRMLQR